MSTGNAPAAATASTQATTSAQKKKKAPRQQKSKDNRQTRLDRLPDQTARAQLGNRPTKSGPGAGISGIAKSEFVDAFTKQDQALLEYVETVTNPWNPVTAGVPMVVGGFTLETDPFQMVYEGEAYAGTNGIAFVQVECSGWVENYNAETPLYQFESYSGGTQGNPIFSSANSVAGATGFMPQGTASSAIFLPTVARLVDPAWNALSRMRVVSAGLEVFSDASQNNATGKVMICSTVLPFEAAGNGGLQGCTFGQIVTTPKKLVERAEMPLSGWKSGDVLRAYAIPSQQAAFQLNTLPAAGTLTSGVPILGAIAIGMTTGQSFSWRVTYNFEAIADLTNKTNNVAKSVVHAGSDRIGNVLPHVKPFATVGGHPSVLNAVPVAANALHEEMMITRPGHASKMINAAKAKDSNIFAGASALAKGALEKVAEAGWLKNIPVFGNAIDTGAKLASKLWNSLW